MFVRRIPTISGLLGILMLLFSVTAQASLPPETDSSGARTVESGAITVIDDFEDGSANDWLFFGGNAAGGGSSVLTDRPYEGTYYFSTGWGGEGTNSGFYGGAYNNFDNGAQITLPADPQFSVWVFNQSDATVDGYTLEITIREDLDGNGWTDGSEDSFRLDTAFTSADFNNQWTQITAPVSSFMNLNTGGNGTFDGKLDEIVIVIAGVTGGSGSTVELDFDLFAFDAGTPPPASGSVIDDFEDGDASDWLFFGGNAAGGGSSVGTDRPYEGTYYFSTGWGGEGTNSGFYGGAYKNFENTAQVDVPADAQFSVWVLNQSNATVDGYTLEITIREDLDGNGWTDGAEDSFRLDTSFVSTNFNDQWTQITAPVSSFMNLNTGGNGTFDGKLDEIVIVIAGVTGGSGSTVELDFDLFEFSGSTPPPASNVIDDFEDGDASDWLFFGGNAAGGGSSVGTDRPYEGTYYFSTGWGGEGTNSGFYGGAYKNFENTAQVDVPADAQFSVWVLNQSNATVDGYTLEITIREDLDGNGWTDGAEDSFRLDTSFVSTNFNDQWTQITAPVSSFMNLNTGGNGTFDGKLDEIVIVIAGVTGGSGSTVELDFDLFEFSGSTPPPADVTVIDDFEDGDAGDWNFFGGNAAGGGGGAFSDRPYEGTYYFSTGWGGEGTGSGFYGGAFKNFDNTAQITPPADPYLSVWVLNQSDATVDQYTLEITIREDLDGNGWTDGAEDSFRLDTTFLSTNFNDQWTQISAPLSGLINLNTGGDGTFNGNLDEVVIVIAGVTGGSGSTVELDFDLFAFTAGNPNPGPKVAFQSNSYSAVEGATATISATLSAASADTVTVSYATSDGSGGAGVDYTATSGELVFAPGDLVQSFTVETIDNTANDDDRTAIVTLSNPVNADLGLPSGATLTIIDDETDAPSGKGVVIEDYEGGELISGEDADGNTVGYEFFAGGSSTVDIALTDTPPAPRPGAADGNTVLQEDLFITSGSFSGFSYKFTNANADAWVPQDWSGYAGIGFWLYGNNTGGIIFIDIQDNRNPGSTTDDAERWSIDITDNFTGWQYFEFGFDEFNRKDVGNGAPVDGFNLTEIHGYAFGGFGAQPMDASYYIDDVSLVTRVDVIDDFENTTLPSGQDANGISVGYFGVAGGGGAINLSITDSPSEQVPNAPAGNKVLVEDMTLPSNAFAVYVHAFSNETVDEWVPVNWLGYEGVCFWLYGHGTGGVLFLDILDNRNPDSTTDDAERYSVDIADNFTGWQFFQFTWDQLNRKEIGNNAPNDGLNLTEVHGYAIGGFGSVDMGQHDYYVDNFSVWGTSGADRPLTAEFELGKYEVTEGETATIGVKLSRVSADDVTVAYATAESKAIPDRDFMPVSSNVVIPAGETTATFTIETIDDNKNDGDKNLMVVVQSAENAELGFRRQAVLNILDNDRFVPQLADDFEGFYPYQTAGNITLTIEEIMSGAADERPNQGTYEQVLDVAYDTAGGSASFMRNYAEPVNWSTYKGMSFWFYGSGSGETYTVELMDNQAATTSDTSPSDWEMVWSDEFDDAAGTQPNSTDWGYELGDGSLNGIPGWGNAEFQYYSNDPANVAMDGAGNLAITMLEMAEDTDLVCYYGPCRYTSARILTKGKTEFEYGRLEARIQVPAGESGLWPAFWTLGSDIDEVTWPATGEIDIMEYVSRVPNEIFGTIHGPGYSGGAAFGGTHNFGEPVSNDYHTYTIEWIEDSIVWYVDGIQYHQADPTDVSPNTWAFNDDPFFMLLNMAIGGNFGGTISDNLTFPQTMLVDYVRVYQAPDSAERFNATFVDDTAGWKHVTLPFADFVRSADQPANAPDDGLGLTEMWGYSFHMPESDSGRTSVAGGFKLDEVLVIDLLPTSVDLATTDGKVDQIGSAGWLIPILLVVFAAVLLVTRRRQRGNTVL